MNISGIKPSSQDNISSKRSSLDSRESELRKQITDLREKKKAINNDKEKTNEEKREEKQAVQEEIQSLSSELRQYQIQKRQEEAAKKAEDLKEASKEANEEKDDEEKLWKPTVFGNEESGVLISLSTTKDQIANMKRIRSGLQRRQRTAATDEEKADLQKKVNNVARNLGRKITITEDTVSKLHSSKKKGAGAQQNTNQTVDWKEENAIVHAADDPDEPYGVNMMVSRKKFFSTVSVFIK